ncbi:hypothetical protein BHE74_00018368 [Ensete ventricosum]|nr:hypothetical protein GW17_00021168 [Ensete ventricosum]RWW73724.1 hypothetical protein BHE74_00018368 [Ensete ventricosum]
MTPVYWSYKGNPQHIFGYIVVHIFRVLKLKRSSNRRGRYGSFDHKPSHAMTFYLQKLCLFVCKDKLFLKCNIQLNQLWFLMQYSLISGYFHDFTEERTMMLKVFPDDDLGSTAHDRKKE